MLCPTLAWLYRCMHACTLTHTHTHAHTFTISHVHDYTHTHTHCSSNNKSQREREIRIIWRKIQTDTLEQQYRLTLCLSLCDSVAWGEEGGGGNNFYSAPIPPVQAGRETDSPAPGHAPSLSAQAHALPSCFVCLGLTLFELSIGFAVISCKIH